MEQDQSQLFVDWLSKDFFWGLPSGTGATRLRDLLFTTVMLLSIDDLIVSGCGGIMVRFSLSTTLAGEHWGELVFDDGSLSIKHKITCSSSPGSSKPQSPFSLLLKLESSVSMLTMAEYFLFISLMRRAPSSSVMSELMQTKLCAALVTESISR